MENKRQKLELADIFSANMESVLASTRLVSTQKRAFIDIVNCRTEKLGGHLRTCNNCSYQEQAYNSCRNRHCPKCQFIKKTKWIDKLSSNLPPVKYFHLVFTVPDSLNSLFYYNQKEAYNLLFWAASKSLMQVASSTKFLGAKTGSVAILHTWGQNLAYHPHIHMIVPAGGLSEDGSEWIPSNTKFLLPVKVLSSVFRGMLFRSFENAIKQREIGLPNQIVSIKSLKTIWYKKKWVVYAKKPFASPKNLINYLGNYTHRVAITNHRLLKHESGRVTFRYKDYKNAGLRKDMTLDEMEFIRRFLQHILPSGFSKIRYYGFLSLRFLKANLERCVNLLDKDVFLPKFEGLNAAETIGLLFNKDLSCCPKCKKGRMNSKLLIKASPS